MQVLSYAQRAPPTSWNTAGLKLALSLSQNGIGINMFHVITLHDNIMTIHRTHNT